MCSENFQMLGIYLRVNKNNPRFTDLSLGFAFQQFQAVSMGPPHQFFFNCFYLMKQWIFKFTEMKKKKYLSSWFYNTIDRSIAMPLVKKD